MKGKYLLQNGKNTKKTTENKLKLKNRIRNNETKIRVSYKNKK